MSLSSLRIIDLSPNDRPLIDALVPLSMRAAARLGPRWLPTAERARAEVVDVATGPGLCLVALLDDVPSGWIGAERSSETAWEIHPLLVDPDRHRQGLGRRLVDDAERRVRSTGALTIHLSTADSTGTTALSGVDLFDDPLGTLVRVANGDIDAGAAVRFWQSVGYAVVGAVPDAEGIGAPSLQLAKSLRADRRPRTR